VNHQLAREPRDARQGRVVPVLPPPPAAPSPVPAVAEIELPPPQHWLRRLGRTELTMHYNRLIALVLVINAWTAVATLRDGLWTRSHGQVIDTLATLVVVNLTAAVVIRQHYVVNLLFWLATRAPTSWPLSIRWTLAKVYHFGGIHVGGAIAATSWSVALLATLAVYVARGASPVSPLTLVLLVAILGLLVAISITARPSHRQRRHDRFERIHRLGGWSSLLVFWGLTISLTADLRGDATLAAALAGSLNTWLLCAVTFSVALPWLRLRKVAVEIVRPSSHVALTRFDHGVTPFAGSSTAISRHPLLEWHSFANIPEPGRGGFRLAISRSGDWTGSFIDDAPSHVWVKGVPTAGVANIEVLFKRVIYVATGSGIGPCLPHLLACEVPSRLVWSTRSPRRTYGDALLDEILAVQPDPIIWDTDERGTPDLVKLAYRAYVEFGAEAVICIANKKLTWRVVEAMEARGIPAYGAIWDS
jgi:hypothetical protein